MKMVFGISKMVNTAEKAITMAATMSRSLSIHGMSLKSETFASSRDEQTQQLECDADSDNYHSADTNAVNFVGQLAVKIQETRAFMLPLHGFVHMSPANSVGVAGPR